MRDLKYYTFLSVTDLFRLWRTTQNHVIIVAGICLPLFLLLGIKSGFIDEMSKELLESPTGRQVTCWSGQEERFLTKETLDTFKSGYPGIELVIPDVQRVVQIRSKNDDQKAADITLYPTVPEDPVLKSLGVPPLGNNRQIILAQATMDQLELKTGDQVDLMVSRVVNSETQQHKISDLKIIGTFNLGDTDANIGYCTIDAIDGIEQYIQGFAFEDFGLPSATEEYYGTYNGYLVFSAKELSPTSDITPLKRNGYRVRRITDETISEQVRQPLHLMLTNLFSKQVQQTWSIYFVDLQSSNNDSSTPLRYSARAIKRMFSSEDIHVLPWANPAYLKSEQTTYCLLGIELSRISYLRSQMNRPGLAFRGTETNSMVFRSANPDTGTQQIKIPINETEAILLNTTPDDTLRRVIEAPEVAPDDAAETGDESAEPVHEVSLLTRVAKDEPLAVCLVPLALLTGLNDFQEQLCLYDPIRNAFLPKQPSIKYERIRIYCWSIDEVPTVVSSLINDSYIVLSEKDRIDEIHSTNRSLNILVLVVGCAVIGFGIFTVVSVLSDSTDRKRGTIGILRVMGVSKIGVFYIVVLRAGLIGVLSGVLSIVIGYGIEMLISAQVSVTFTTAHILTVLGGALLCSGVGAIVPAYKASNLDPFEAILEGKTG